MNEEVLQKISRALTHLVYRNTVIEDLHVAGASLDNDNMKKINKDVNNRIYTLLKWYFSGGEEDKTFVEQLVSFAAMYGNVERKKCSNLRKALLIAHTVEIF